MGDIRYSEPYRRVKNAANPTDEIRRLTDEEAIAALAAAAAEGDRLVSNVLATDAQNRVSLYAAIQTTMAEGVFAVGPLGRVTALNPAAERTLGWTLEEARGADMDALLSCTVLDRQGIWQSRSICADALQARHVKQEEEALFTRRDGTRFPASYTAAPILRDDDVQGAVVVFRDISARRKTEESVRRLAAIVQATEDAIYSCDVDGRVTSWNPGCERRFGYPAEEAIGSFVGMLFAPHRAQQDRAILARVERGEMVRNHETQRVTKDGRLVDVSASIAPVRSPEGRVTGFSSIDRDIHERVHAQRALQEARQLLSAIVEGTTDIVYAKDREGKYLLFNHAGARLFGVSQEALVGKADADFLEPDAVRRAREQEAAIMAEGAPRTFEEPLTIRGREHVYLTTKAPLRDADGRIVGIVGISHDITARNRSEDAARRLAAIVEASDDAILSLGLDGTILTWNPRAEALYGYPAAEAVGKNAALVVPPELRDAYGELLARVGRGEELHYHATKRLQRGGKLLDISLTATPIRDEDGKVIALSWISQDITEAKRREEALRASEERYRLLLDSVTDHAIFLLDPKGHVATWNPAAQRIKGWKAEEIIGWHYSVLFPPEEVAQGDPWKELQDAITTGQHSGEERRIRKDGTLFDASVTLSAMRDPEGKLVGFVKVTRDISERKAWERRLQLGEARYNHLFETFTTPALWCDAAGGVVAGNQALLALLSFEPSDIVGRPLTSLAHPKDHERVLAAMTAAQQGAQGDVRFAAVTKEGKPIEATWRLRPLVVDGRAVGFFAVGEDARPRGR